MQTITIPCRQETNPETINAALEAIQGQGAFCERADTAHGAHLRIHAEPGMLDASATIADALIWTNPMKPAPGVAELLASYRAKGKDSYLRLIDGGRVEIQIRMSLKQLWCLAFRSKEATGVRFSTRDERDNECGHPTYIRIGTWPDGSPHFASAEANRINGPYWLRFTERMDARGWVSITDNHEAYRAAMEWLAGPTPPIASKAPATQITRDQHGTGWDCGNRNAFYDRQTRVWILTHRDPEGNQIGDAEYCAHKPDAFRFLKTGTLSPA